MNPFSRPRANGFLSEGSFIPHSDGGGSEMGIAIFCLVALVRASVTDPGRLPENPKIPHGGMVLFRFISFTTTELSLLICFITFSMY